MIKQIREWFNSYPDTIKAVNYLTNYINYNFTNNHDPEFTKFGKGQLRFLVQSRWQLSDKQVDKVIKITLSNIVTNTKSGFMVTKNAIYLAAGYSVR